MRYLLCVMVLAAGAAHAQLELQLPEPEWLLSSVRLPLGQREALIQPSELGFYQQLRPLIEARDYATASEVVSGRVDPTEELPYAGFSPAMNYVIGQLYISTERLDEAEEVLQFALGQLPDFVRAHQALAFLYLQTARFDAARPHVTAAVELGGFNAELFGYLGYLNQETENYMAAANAYQQAVMLDDENPQWKQGLLFSLIASQQYRPALAMIETLLRSGPDDADLWLYRAHLYRSVDDFRQALESLEIAIRLGKDELQNLQVAAQLHLEEGSHDRAVELMEASSARGLDFVYLNQMAAWLVREARWEHARRIVDAARARWDELSDSEQSEWLVHEAGVASGTGRAADAIAALEEALTLDPGNARALVDLGSLYADSGRSVQAGLLFDRATAYADVREAALLLHAQMAVDANDYEKALELLREAVAQNPTRFDLLENIRILEGLVTAQR